MAITKAALKSNIHSFLEGLGNQIATSALKGVPLVGDLGLPVGQAVFAALLPVIDKAIDSAGPDAADLVKALNGVPGITATVQGNDIAIRVQANEVLSLADETFSAGAAAAGIGLSLSGQFKTSLSASLNANLRVDGTSGDIWVVDPGTTKELTLQLRSNLSLDASGKLGIIGIDAKDADPNAPEVQLTAAFDLAPGKALDAIAAPLKPSFTGSAGLDLKIDTQVAGGALPSIGAALKMNYDLTTSKVAIAFQDVTLDIGSLLKSFSAPFGLINDILDSFPLGIILDIATDPLPVIDALAHKTGLDNALDVVPSIVKDGKITLADLAVIAEGLNSEGVGKFFDGLATLALVREIAKGISTGKLELGDFSVANDPQKSIDTFAGLLPAAAKSAFDDIVKSLAGGDSLSSKGGFSIPILNDPTLIVKLLLNKLYPDPVTIVQFDLPDLKFDYRTYVDFPILGPLGLTLEGDAGVAIDIGVGYDSYAFKTGDVKDGLFLTNFNEAGNASTTEPVAELTAGVHAGVVLNAVVLRASATGGINFLVDAFLRDPNADGKTRLSEMNEFFIKPEGKAFADVRVRLTIGFGIFSYTKTIPLVSVVLVDFSLSSNGKPPVSPPDHQLATLVSGNLLLNTGPRASIRILSGVQGNDDTDIEGYEIGYALDPKTHAVIPGALAVSAFGTTQVFGGAGAGPFTISGDLGKRDDSLVVSANVTQAITVHGGDGDDMIVGGAGADRIYGDNGNNYLVGNDGNDLLQGGSGADTLIGGAGADKLFGAGGLDNVSYEDAKQTVGVRLRKIAGIAEIAGFGGEAEGDRLTGIDHVTGTNFDDELRADDYADNAPTAPRTLEGLGGNDKLVGGAGNDFLIGGAGGDLLAGGGGRNAAGYVASAGGVTIDLDAKVYYGAEANGDWYDFVRDASGKIVLDSAGNPVVSIQDIYGSGFADTLSGDSRDNVLGGFLGDDTLDGRLGRDTVSGDEGNDPSMGAAMVIRLTAAG